MIGIRYWLSLGIICVLCGDAISASPQVTSVLPRGVQINTEAVLTLAGVRIADAREVLFYSPGLTVTKIEPVNDNSIKATVKVAPDCRLGEHAFRLRTATGVSEMVTVSVGALPAVEEKEPNNDFAAPQEVPLNCTVHGIADNEDIDYYIVEAKKGQRLVAEVEGLRLASTTNPFDPAVAILDMKRFELAASDDAPLLGQDAAAAVVVPEDGKYVVAIRETSYRGNGACRYRLHIGTFPRPTAVLPAGGKPGEELEVTFLGDVSGPIKQKVKLPTTMPPGYHKFGLFCRDAGGISPSFVPFMLTDLPNVIESGENNTLPTATVAPVFPAAFNGVISKAKEYDHFRFKAVKGQTFEVHCHARKLGSSLDPVMVLFNDKGAALASNDDANGSPDSYFRWAVPADGEYVVRVHDHLLKGGPTYTYRIEFTPVKPDLAVSLPNVGLFASQERQVIPVPKGNRYTTLVNVQRLNVGGEVALSAAGMPAGVSLTSSPVPADTALVPVVFEAAPTAEVAGTLAELKLETTDPKQPKVTGQFRQLVTLVHVPNQGVYWTNTVDRVAVAVTEEAPFKVEIVQPKVPLVRNGSMVLKIRAERKPDFKAPITIIPLISIPGVGNASSAVIPEGQTETTLAINANNGAPIRPWKIAVMASATVGNGPVYVGSPLATLEIAAPFVSFTMEKGAVEQGKETTLFAKVSIDTPFEGKAKVRLLGLPNKVTTTELEITKDSTELTFPVKTEPTSPAGTHRNLFCQVVIEKDGEPITHSVGTTELRVDVPIVKPVAPAVVAAPPTAPPPPQPAAPKRLTRLEQLRLEQQEREKAASK